jgi:mannose-6-phosphate isomerase-like protein (cupin superfamily)
MKNRRATSLLGGLALVATTPAPGAEPAASRPADVRRVVTVVDGADGAKVLADGPTMNVVELNGSRITRLWETGGLPVPLDVVHDQGATAGNAYRAGFTGTSLYTADIPPGSDLGDIPLHAQDSLDYIAVLSGTIDLVLPDRTLTLHPGEVLVQAGNRHSWVNRSNEYCRLLVVVLTGRRTPPP